MTTPKYGGLLTDIGAAALIAASEAGKKWQPTHMLIGDAGGAPGETADPIPSAAQTKLIRQRYRAQLNRLFVSEQSANVLIAELVLPMAIGGFWIREIGLEDADGKFVAVANCPPSFKASVESGSARTQTIRVQIIISGMEHVELIIDDGIVYATQDWVKAKVAADFKGRKVLAGNGLVGGGDLSADRTIALPASGVGAGTYRAVTVNANGIVTAGSNPTTLGGYGITDALHASEAVTTPTANKLLRLNAAGLLPASITGNATTASRLAAPITLSATGDATWAARFDGSSSVSGTLTLANTGVAVGTYTKVRVNAKGLVTSATSLTADDIPWLDASKLATGILPVARGGTGNAIGQAATALKLASPRTLAIAGDATGSAAFDGSANASITVTLANTGVADGTYTKVRVNPKGSSHRCNHAYYRRHSLSGRLENYVGHVRRCPTSLVRTRAMHQRTQHDGPEHHEHPAHPHESRERSDSGAVFLYPDDDVQPAQRQRGADCRALRGERRNVCALHVRRRQQARGLVRLATLRCGWPVCKRA